MTLADFVAVMRRWWFIPALSVVTAILALVGIVLLRGVQQHGFETTVRMAVQAPPEDAQLPEALSPPITRQEELATSSEVVEEAQRLSGEVDGPTPTVSAAVDPDTQVVSVTAQARDEDTSRRFALAMAEAYQQRRLDLVLADLETRQQEVRDRLEALELRLQETQAGSTDDPAQPDPGEVARIALVQAQIAAIDQRISEKHSEYGTLAADAIVAESAGDRAAIAARQEQLQQEIVSLQVRREQLLDELPPGEMPIAATSDGGAAERERTEDDEEPNPFELGGNLSVSEAQAAALRNQIVALRAEFATLVAQEAAVDDGARVIETLPTTAVNPQTRPLVFPAALLGAFVLLAGIGLPLLLDRADHTVRDRSDAAELLGAPVLGQVPTRVRRRREPITVHRPNSDAALAYRNMAPTLLMALQGVPNQILVTGPSGSRVASAVALNLATSLARLGIQTVLVGTQPDHSWYVGACELDGEASDVGFRELLTEEGDVTQEDVERSMAAVPSVEQMRVVPPGSAEIRESDARRIGRVLSALDGKHSKRLSIIAGPPLLGGRDAAVYARQAARVLWVVETRRTRIEDLLEARDLLDLTAAQTVGVVLVG